MARSSNYPAKSFENAMEFATQVDKLGGKCTVHTLADKLGKKITGSFNNDINASIKHNLLLKEGLNLKITEQYSNIKLAYTEEEKLHNKQIAFLAPSTYREILVRFDGIELPISVLDKVLIREYLVIEGLSKTVANNILKGGEKLKLINGGIVHLPEYLKSTDFSDENKIQAKEKHTVTKKDNSKPTPVKQKAIEENSIEETNSNFESSQKQQNLASKVNIEGLHKEVIININIQLSVPETTNEEVYEKFFAAMKKNLLS